MKIFLDRVWIAKYGGGSSASTGSMALHRFQPAYRERARLCLTPPKGRHPSYAMPRLFVIGGPNGAGKTTVAGGLLPEILECDEYVNADAIAKALSPFESDRAAFKAGRLMLEAIHNLAAQRKDFAFETTMASRTFAPFLGRCRAQGYEINLLFLWLGSVALAKRRVAKRVRSGGHGIPKDVIRRRYRSGVRNFWKLYLPLADNWVVYDNSGRHPVLVAQSLGDGKIRLHHARIWSKIRRIAE
jgi:predicted ABC-type ATPase